MLFKKLSAPSLKELFVAELEGMILSGKLEIGAKLPPERELAESMQVSRAVVNSGLDEMEKKGFLVVKPRIGTFVADYRKYGTADTLVSIMQYNGGMLRDKEVRSILEVRIMFMNLAATLAIDNADDASIAGLEQYVTALKVGTASGQNKFLTCEVIGGRKKSYPSISAGMHLEIRIKKWGISKQPVFASAVIRVFPSFEHSTGVSAIRRQF